MMGYQTIASGSTGTAMGLATTAFGEACYGMGLWRCKWMGYHAFRDMGRQTSIWRSKAMGHSTDVMLNSIAMGFQTMRNNSTAWRSNNCF